MSYTVERGKKAEAALGCLVLGLGLAGFAVYNREWFREVLNGPTAVSPDELSKAKSLQSVPARYVRLEAAEYKETKIRRVIRRRGNTPTDYVLIRVGDRWLAAAMDSGPRPRTVVGYLGPLNETELGSCWEPEVMPDLARILPGKEADRLMPFRLDAKQDHDGMGRALLFGSVGLSLLSLGLAAWFFRQLLATPAGDTSPAEGPRFTPASGEKARAGEEWRWR